MTYRPFIFMNETKKRTIRSLKEQIKQCFIKQNIDIEVNIETQATLDILGTNQQNTRR